MKIHRFSFIIGFFLGVVLLSGGIHLNIIPAIGYRISNSFDVLPGSFGDEEVATYRNEDLGIEFDYPKAWGTIKPDRVPTQALSFFHLEEGQGHLSMNLFLATSVRGSELPARGGYWGDISRDIDSEDFVKHYCDDKSSAVCNTYTTESGIIVTRSLEDVLWRNNIQEIYYYIKPSKPELNGLVLTAERLRPEEWASRAGTPLIYNIAEKFDALVASIKFIQ